MSSSSTNTNNNSRAVDDLIHMIDHHLAFDLSHDDRALRSQTSKGTLFVDYDGTDVPIVSYRHQTHRPATSDPRRDSAFESLSSDARSLPAGPTARVPSPLLIVTSGDFDVRRHRGPGGGVYVDDVDCLMGCECACDGNVAHVHRDGRPFSGLLEYFEVDAGAWELQRREYCEHNAHSSSRRQRRHRHRHRHADVPLKVLDLHKELPRPPADREFSKREKIAAFIAGLREKLACLGVLEHRHRRREYGHRRRYREHGHRHR
jgi:hypothetical protein